VKVTYPLSLKILLWLLLNFFVLAALAIGFFVAQGGLGWSALVAGPGGDAAQAKAIAIAREHGSADVRAQATVLKDAATTHHAEFFLARVDDRKTLEALPPTVTARVEALRLMPGRGPFGRDFGSGRGEFGPPEAFAGNPREKGPRREPPPDETSRREIPPEAGRDRGFEKRFEPPDPMRERETNRFLERTGTPTGYWVGFRVPIIGGPGRRPAPAMLVARFDSLWPLLRFLDLQSWLVAGTGVLAFSVLFWWPLVRGITRSVGQLTRATEQIAEGRFDTRVEAQRRDELGKLGDSVNRMATRLEAHMTGQKRFLGDVAHELCSPLARLQMAAGILAEQAPADLKETVADVRDEVQQMSTLVNELLAFTKAGLQPREVALRVVEVGPLMLDVLNREAAGDRVTLSTPADLRVKADPDLLARALGNLVRNALRYAAEAGPITVTAAHNNGRVTIAVEDLGPGVPPADLDRLGEPFFRPELARTRETGGVGLGLAIVRNSIAACGGEVRFANRTPHGFRAELRLAAA
jgi:two-component system, OmpR family, sensor histidine kinase CpxA